MAVSLPAIRQMIKNRQYEDARSALQAYLRENPKSAQAWYLLSLADTTTPKRIAAARRAAKLAPKNTRVLERLEKLQESSGSRSGANRGRTVLMIVAILALVIVGIAFAPRVIQMRTQVQETLQAAAATSTAEKSITSAKQPTSTPSPDVTEEITAITATPNISPTAPPTQTATFTPTKTATLTPTDTPSPSPTAEPPTPTSTFTAVPPTLPPPTIPPPTLPPPTVIPQQAAALNEALEVGTGQMWIVASTRSAEGLIAQLGGIIDPAPPGSNWVLVELFMICSGTGNCGPQPADIQIVGPSRVPYTVPEGFTVQPVFGPNAYTEGQVWGYLGFIVPNSESTLTLVLNQFGQQYAFDLQ